MDNYEVSSGKNSSNKDKQKDSQNFLILSFVLWSNSGLHYEQKLLGHGWWALPGGLIQKEGFHELLEGFRCR